MHTLACKSLQKCKTTIAYVIFVVKNAASNGTLAWNVSPVFQRQIWAPDANVTKDGRSHLLSDAFSLCKNRRAFVTGVPNSRIAPRAMCEMLLYLDELFEVQKKRIMDTR